MTAQKSNDLIRIMSGLLQNLSVEVFRRPVYDRDRDGVPFALGFSESVVAIHHRDGRSWELTLDGDRVTSIKASGPDVQADSLNGLPVRTLAEIAKAHLALVDAEQGQGLAADDAATLAAADFGDARTGTPTLAEFAEVWRSMPPKVVDPETGETLTRRQALAKRYRAEAGISAYAVDKWVGLARERGLIPPAPGRKRGPRPQKKTS